MKFNLHLLLLFWLSAMIMACSNDSDSDNVIREDENGNEEIIDTSANKRSVGDSANDLLSEANFDRLIVELMYVQGLAPQQASIDNFRAFLEARLNKSGAIEIISREISSPMQMEYSIQDIRQLEDANRQSYNEGSTIAVSGIFIDGEYDQNTENGSVLGVAYRNTSFVIFEETIRDFSGQPLAPSRSTLETVVINHEFGHLLGLVNAGTPLQSDHQDVANGRHCDQDDCLMYWTAETGEGLLNMLTGGTVPELDTFCLQDLQANGGK